MPVSSPKTPRGRSGDRMFLGSVLSRAELAAQQLVFVSASMQARPGFTWVRSETLAFDDNNVASSSGDDALATKALVRRMRALHALLEDLPRRGRRLLRRQAKRCLRAVADGWRCLGEEWFADVAFGRRDESLPARRIERPPDKYSEGFAVRFFTFLPMRAEGEGV